MDERRLREKMVGKTRYPQHISSKNQLYIFPITSNQSCGILENLDIPELPEDYHLITARDIPGRNWIDCGQGGMPLLTEKQVRYKGEPLALLAGPDPIEVQTIARRIEIKITPIPPIPEASLMDSQYCSYNREFRSGDSEEIFQKKDLIQLEDYYEMDSQELDFYPVGHSSCQKDGAKLVVHSLCQWPWLLRKSLSEMLKLKQEQLIHRSYNQENHREAKLIAPIITAAFCALVTHLHRRTSTLLLEPWQKELGPMASGKCRIYLKAASNQDGDLLALKLDFTQDMGAWPLWDKERVDRMCFTASGVYHCRDVEIQGKAQLTNRRPSGWNAQGSCGPIFTALELFSAQLAQQCGLTPRQWKERNILRKGNGFFTGALMHRDPKIDELIQQVCTRSDYDRKYSAYQYQLERRKEGQDGFNNPKGIGLSLGFLPNGFINGQREFHAASLELLLDQEGQLKISLPALPGHQQLYKHWTTMASETLSIDEKNISFQLLDYQAQLSQGPSSMGRNITVINSLLDQGLKGIASRRFRDPLPLLEKKRFNRNVRRWKEEDFQGMPFQYLSFGSMVVELTLDRETNQVEMNHCWLSLDCGTMLLPKLAPPLVERGIRQSLKWLNQGLQSPLEMKRIPFHLQLESTGAQAKPLEGLVELLFPGAFLQALEQATGKSQHGIPFSLTGIQQEEP